MSDLQTIKVPDIGDVDDVEVIEVLVSVGDTIEVESSLITIESDKASMEVPSPSAGVITSILVSTGDRVSEGSDIVVLDVAQAVTTASTADEPAPKEATAAAITDTGSSNTSEEKFDLLVLGAGPGGYTAAFRAADLGLNVLLVERYPDLGGVCLNVGCIPSKALLHTAAIIQETQEMAAHGVNFAKPTIDIDKLRGFKEDVIGKLTNGLAGLAKQRKVTVAHGVGQFTSAHTLSIQSADGSQRTVGFSQAIIAAGSQSVRIPNLPYDDPRLMDSSGALALADIPKRLLIIGGGIIGLEMGCVYAGSRPCPPPGEAP